MPFLTFAPQELMSAVITSAIKQKLKEKTKIYKKYINDRCGLGYNTTFTMIGTSSFQSL